MKLMELLILPPKHIRLIYHLLKSKANLTRKQYNIEQQQQTIQDQQHPKVKNKYNTIN